MCAVVNIVKTHFVKEGFSEDSVVVAGGEVAGVEGVAELAGVVAGDLSPVLPEGAVAASEAEEKHVQLACLCHTHCQEVPGSWRC